MFIGFRNEKLEEIYFKDTMSIYNFETDIAPVILSCRKLKALKLNESTQAMGKLFRSMGRDGFREGDIEVLRSANILYDKRSKAFSCIRAKKNDFGCYGAALDRDGDAGVRPLGAGEHCAGAAVHLPQPQVSHYP